LTERLVLLGTPECHLCHSLAEVVRAAIRGSGLTVEEQDIRLDAELDSLYRHEIPVLLAGEREVLRHRATEAQVRARLRELGLL
jgi:thioredoxin reductase (NADPH)